MRAGQKEVKVAAWKADWRAAWKAVPKVERKAWSWAEMMVGPMVEWKAALTAVL